MKKVFAIIGISILLVSCNLKEINKTEIENSARGLAERVLPVANAEYYDNRK